jgi:hypothetical protein
MQNANNKLVEEGFLHTWYAHSRSCSCAHIRRAFTVHLLIHSLVLGIMATIACQPSLASLGDDTSIDKEHCRFTHAIRHMLTAEVDSDGVEAIENTVVEFRRCDLALEAEGTAEDDTRRRISLDHGINVHIPRAYLPERNVDRTGVSIGIQPLGTRAFVTVAFSHNAITYIQLMAERYGDQVQEVIERYFEHHNAFEVTSNIYTTTRQEHLNNRDAPA